MIRTNDHCFVLNLLSILKLNLEYQFPQHPTHGFETSIWTINQEIKSEAKIIYISHKDLKI